MNVFDCVGQKEVLFRERFCLRWIEKGSLPFSYCFLSVSVKYELVKEMVKRARMRRVTRKPFGVFVDGVVQHQVYSPEECEEVMRGIDRKKHKVRLK